MVYLQSNEDRKLPHHFDVACAMYGAIDNSQDIRLTTFEEVSSGRFDLLIRNNLFVGSTEFMKEVFSRINKHDVKLPENSNRTCRIMTLGESKKIVNELNIKLFIKPIDIKLFTGFVLDQMKYTSISSIPDDTMVMVYDVFESRISSEYRCYIHRNKIVDIRNYSGDLFTFPDKDYIESVIKTNMTKFPVAYTIDIGVLENGENVVVEYNDMWAIGNYGIDNTEYYRLLRDRYFEIVKN